MLLSPEVKNTSFGVLTKVSLKADMISHELLGEEGGVSPPPLPTTPVALSELWSHHQPATACEETLKANGSSQHQDIFGTFER